MSNTISISTQDDGEGQFIQGQPYTHGHVYVDDSDPAGHGIDSDEQAKISINTFLMGLEVATERLRASLTTGNDPELNRMGLSMSQHMQAARLIHFDPWQATEIYSQVERYVTERVLGLAWRGPDGPEPSKEEADYYRRELPKKGHVVALPEEMPFQSVYLGFGQGLGLRPHLVSAKLGALVNGGGSAQPYIEKLIKNPPVHAKTCGFFVGSGWVIELFCAFVLTGKESPAETRDKIAKGIRPKTTQEWSLYPWRSGADPNHHHPGAWLPSHEITPWYIRSLINLVNSYRTVILGEEARPVGYRNLVRPTLKRLGVSDKTPPPFYRVQIKTQVLRDKAAGAIAGVGHKKSYRSDTRGHETVKAQRGSMPLDPKMEKWLLKKRPKGGAYRIYTTADVIPQDDLDRLSVRQIRLPKPGEWIAVLNYWRETFVSPKDESLPYVPKTLMIDSDRLPKQEAG